MRKLFFILSVVIVFVSCKNKTSEVSSGVVKHDTIRVLGCWVDMQNKKVLNGPIWITIRDTFVYKRIDSTTIKRTWAKDSMFFTPKIVKDSATGTERLEGVPTAYETISFHKDFDSAVAILNRWIDSHPQYFQVDSTKKTK